MGRIGRTRFGTWGMALWSAAALAPGVPLAPAAESVPVVERCGDRIGVRGAGYRAVFSPEIAGLSDFQLRADGTDWESVAERAGDIATGLYDGRERAFEGARAAWVLERCEDAVVIGQRLPWGSASGGEVELHYLCVGEGVLMCVRVGGGVAAGGGARLWFPPRIRLAPARWQSYRFWDAEERPHAGEIGTLAPLPAYAGVSGWGRNGDVVGALSALHPGLLLRGVGMRDDLCVVGMPCGSRREQFLQRHTGTSMFLYGGVGVPPAAGEIVWGWLAPVPRGGADGGAAAVERLLTRGREWIGRFRPVAPPIPCEWRAGGGALPDALRRSAPVIDPRDAMVYIVGEDAAPEHLLEIVRRTGAEVIVRGWFKWNRAPRLGELAWLPERARALGARFGGGITCSALYDDENGITRAQLLDMATRDPDGDLVDAWGSAGVRHGSLSSPAYLDFLFRWAREQIDAGVDYLFMDEHTAALEEREGYDDHSVADFRRFLLDGCEETRGWGGRDRRWGERFGIDLGDRSLCPDGTVGSFDYRLYLRRRGLSARPLAVGNPLARCWREFRAWRDGRAWEGLTGRIRARARERGGEVWISANGLAPRVDLQVLGVWGNWRVEDGRIDLSESQIPVWRASVRAGERIAGRRLPVVFFHDWGMGDPPFPYLAVAPSERELWLRVRAAEMCVAGARFAYPALGPFGCDASRDGTLGCIVRQTTFLRRHAADLTRARYLGCERLTADRAGLSLGATVSADDRTVWVHAIHRVTRAEGEYGARVPARAEGVRIAVPLAVGPGSAGAISPEWEGERPVTARADGRGLELGFPPFEAWAVAVLRYDRSQDLRALIDPPRLRPASRWERPETSEFRVEATGALEPGDRFNGLLQGMLHRSMRNPPWIDYDGIGGCALVLRVRSVAVAGARLECRIDGRIVEVVDLPDRDGKNDVGAREWDREISVPLGAGRHRVMVDNVGPDWLTLDSVEFRGAYREAR